MEQNNDAIALGASILLTGALSVLETRNFNCQWWVRPWKADRKSSGAYHHLMNDMRLTDIDSWRRCIRMDHDQFTKLLELVQPLIERRDTILRQAIPAAEKLSICLRYLATGESFHSLSCQFKVGKSTISTFIPEVCQAIYNVLRNEYLKIPNSETDWKQIACEFESLWNFPHCLGAVDGKHVEIRKPLNSGSYYHNYKGRESIVLLAAADATYHFIYVCAGGNGRISDGGLFRNTKLYHGMEDGTLSIPEPEEVDGHQLPYVFVADNAFRMTANLLKPYPSKDITNERCIFNYRLSRARRLIESTFGILVAKWRIYERPIAVSPFVVDRIIMATCVLHNYLKPQNWLTDQSNVNCRALSSLSIRANNSPYDAKEVRNRFCNYFNTSGQLSWQNRAVGINV
ncbi:Uncharacterised protein r2_g114 [Pycnogonum litorale]